MTATDPGFNPSGSDKIASITNAALAFEAVIVANTPPGRRRAVALTKLEECTMWAVKAAAVGDE